MTRWENDSAAVLRSVTEKVAGMESALVTGDVAAGAPVADELVAVTTELLDELDLDPGHDLERDAELISALRVYRNSAFLFRRLSEVAREPDPTIQRLCATMIDQGHDHLQAFVGQTPK